MSDAKFIHLHCHSEYSLLDGCIRVPELVKHVKDQGVGAVALTDNGAMFGVIEFYLAAKENGINPILGCEVLLTDDIAEKKRGFERLLFLAKDLKGYQSLIKIVSIANLDGFYYKPRIDLAHLKQHTEGIIVISPGNAGPVADLIRQHIPEKAKEIAAELKSIFGDDFYLGLTRLGEAQEEMVIEETLSIAKELGISVVATNDVYYLTPEESRNRDILNCIQTGRLLESDTRRSLRSTDQYFRSPDEMGRLFADIPEAIDNTVKIAEKCHLDFDTEQVRLPNFDCPDGLTSEAYLEKLVWDGIRTKYAKVTPEIEARAKMELDIVTRMHFANYFLIIHDFLTFCRQNHIPVGPGRGSAAGSIVAYALNITQIDPLKYQLLFERFLNPERISMPDIDMDFCIKRRGEVIDYIVQKYGTDHVAQIMTLGTMAARGVIRDVGRVLNVPLADVDKIAKLIPSNPSAPMSIAEAVEAVPDLKAMIASNPEFEELIRTASQLEGMSRHTSVHAAGIVISRDPLTTIVPLMKNEGQIITQFQMTDLEKIGLLKLDILGLRNLTVIQESLNLIRTHYGQTVDLTTIPMDEKDVYAMLSDGHTMGVFQLESRGMRALIKELQPRVFEDIIALLALYRPGPLGSGMVSEFISNKSGKTQVKYSLPELEPILKDTYGLILYQEQVMQIASVVGGFTLGQADMLRKAMGKKKKDVMDEMKDKFLDGAKEHNVPLQAAESIFELCYKFAEYGFNKSHSAAYALISYQTAYLKCKFPVAYMAALLSSVEHSSDRTSLYIQECRRMAIPVLPPDVSESEQHHTIIGNTIRFGLGAIKNVGEGAIESIVSERKKNGSFKSLLDFCSRVDLRLVNKRVIESLIKSGALDSQGDRAQLLATYELILSQAQVKAKEKHTGQIGLFSESMQDSFFAQPDIKNAPRLSFLDTLKMEKELLGLYLSGHPLDPLAETLESMPHTTASFTADMDGQPVTLIGFLTNCRKVISKSQREMMIGTLEDLHGQIDILLFAQRDFEVKAPKFQSDTIIKVHGKLRLGNNEELSITVDDIEPIYEGSYTKNVHIDLVNAADPASLKRIQELLLQYPGNVPIFFHVNGVTVKAGQGFWVSEDPDVIPSLEAVLGAGVAWRF